VKLSGDSIWHAYGSASLWADSLLDHTL
jgi:hypothetical protein